MYGHLRKVQTPEEKAKADADLPTLPASGPTKDVEEEQP